MPLLNYGICVSISHVLEAEILSKVYMRRADLHGAHGGIIPSNTAYDDGCHLRRFANLRWSISGPAQSFWGKAEKKILAGRYH